MKVIIDQEKCISCGSCVAVCPDTFELDENSKARFKETNSPVELETDNSGCIDEAVEICPVQVIKIEK